MRNIEGPGIGHMTTPKISMDVVLSQESSGTGQSDGFLTAPSWHHRALGVMLPVCETDRRKLSV